MKKVFGILVMVVMLVAFVFVAFGSTNDTTEKQIEGAVYGTNGSEVCNWLDEWIESVGDKRNMMNMIDENGVYFGKGVIEAHDFEKQYNVDFSFENFEKLARDQYEISEFSIVTAGFYEDYPVYKMYAKGNKIGAVYDYEDEEYIDYDEGSIYFMVVYDD